MPRSHSRRSLSSVAGTAFWSACDFWVQQAAALLVFIVVGNAIGPGAVGVMTMGQLIVTFLMTFLLDGFSDALIQRETLADEHFDTAFWLLLTLGTGACLLLLGAAPLIAGVFGEPELTHVLRMLSLGLPFVGITATYHGILQRELKFRALATRTILAQTTGFVSAIVLAYHGFGVDSLVAYFLLARFLEAVLIVPVSRIRPGVRVRRAALLEIVGFGKHRVGNQLVGFMVMQVDRLSAGLFLGATQVGLYSTAERVASALVNGLSGVVGRVAFPVLSARQSDPDSFERALREFLLAMSTIAVPVFIGISVTSHEIVGVLFNKSWAEAAVLLSVISLAGIPHAFNYLLTAGINARGRPDIAFRYSLVIMTARIIASLAAARYSVYAVAWANLIVTALSTVLVAYSVRTQIRDAGLMLIEAAWAPAAAGLLMAAATLSVGSLLGTTPPLGLLAVKVATGVVTYSAALYLIAPAFVMRHVPRLFNPG